MELSYGKLALLRAIEYNVDLKEYHGSSCTRCAIGQLAAKLGYTLGTGHESEYIHSVANHFGVSDSVVRLIYEASGQHVYWDDFTLFMDQFVRPFLNQ